MVMKDFQMKVLWLVSAIYRAIAELCVFQTVSFTFASCTFALATTFDEFTT